MAIDEEPRWWWSPTLTGGHIPYQLIQEIELFLRLRPPALTPLKQMSDHEAERLAKILAARWFDFHKLVDHQWAREGVVAYQVAATLLMAIGAEMTPGFHRKAIRAGERDDWARSSLYRQIYINEYLQALRAHESGKRRVLAEEDLYDVEFRRYHGRRAPGGPIA